MSKVVTFSISKEFSQLNEEIPNIPNLSRFICEAMIEKLEVEKDPSGAIRRLVEKAEAEYAQARAQMETLQRAGINMNLDTPAHNTKSIENVSQNRNKQSENSDVNRVSSKSIDVEERTSLGSIEQIKPHGEKKELISRDFISEETDIREEGKSSLVVSEDVGTEMENKKDNPSLNKMRNILFQNRD